MFKKILLGVDGSEHALRAAIVAGDLARLTKADVIMVTAFDPIPSYLGEPNLQEAITGRLSQAEKVLETAKQELGAIPGEITTESLEGSAADVVLDVAQARGCDLIIVGSRGLGQLKGLLLGSHSQKIIQHAHCPVLVIR